MTCCCGGYGCCIYGCCIYGCCIYGCPPDVPISGIGCGGGVCPSMACSCICPCACGGVCGAGSGCGVGMSSSTVDAVSLSIFDMMLLHISLASDTGYNCIISLSTKSPISILKVILTNLPSRKSSISPPSVVSCRSIKVEDGGLISIMVFSMDDIDVAEDPIIWFIASLIALKCSSVISPSVFEPSPPIIRSVMIFTSFSRKTKILLPSNPLV